jgi:branched-chain amino acid transport system ATP-binding protein
LLDVNAIDVAYGHIRALHGVSLRVGEAEIVALIGPNGAGKSTTLRTISGLLRPLRGHVRFDGDPIHELAPDRIVELGISHVPEGRGIFPNLTVEENLRMGYFIRRRNRSAWGDAVYRVTTLFPRLAERFDQAAGTLSGGEQQMLALGRALLSEPKLLMVDEPSLGLAPLVVEQLFGALEEINRDGTAILLVEQYVTRALQLASRAYVLENGRVAKTGDAKQLAESDEVASLYLGSGVKRERARL